MFLDRDGTINIEQGYVTRPEDLVLIDGAAAAIRALNGRGVLAVLVSNQSGVARGLMTEGDLARVHERLEDLLLADGARLDGAYYCPNFAGGTVERYTRDARCRKPATEMVEQAVRDLGVDLASSAMVGDHATDMELARALGIPGVLVATGRGRETLESAPSLGIEIAYSAPDLAAAVAWILSALLPAAGGGADAS